MYKQSNQNVFVVFVCSSKKVENSPQIWMRDSGTKICTEFLPNGVLLIRKSRQSHCKHIQIRTSSIFTRNIHNFQSLMNGILQYILRAPTPHTGP